MKKECQLVLGKAATRLRQGTTYAVLASAVLLASCADLTFLRGDGPDLNASSQGTNRDGNQRPPVPKQRVSRAAANAASEENKRIIASYGGVYSNRRVEDQLAIIVSRLVTTSQEPSQSFEVTVLNSPAVNAFALPGGYLYITRGLLALASDASEVAAVLSHEMAHVTSKHGQERLRQARRGQLVSQAVSGVITNPSTLEAIQQRRQLSFAAFTQAQELEADKVGVRNAALAGYDPFAAARFLEVMADYQDYRSTATISKSASGPNFLSSHPSTPERINQARLSARKFGAPGFGTRDKERYLRSLDSMIFGDDPSEGFVRDRSFFHPQLRFTFSVPHGYIIENTREAVLATAESGDAIRFDGVAVPNELTLTDYLQSGWLNGLDINSIKQTNINGSEAASARAQVNEWNFKITVIRAETSTYRMIFATKRPSTQFDRAVSSTVASFRGLSEEEARRLSPLRLQIVEVKPGDTSFTLSRSMRSLVTNPDQAFRALNGLGSTKQPQPGSFVKVITDGVSG